MYDDFVTDGDGSGSEVAEPEVKKIREKSTKYGKDDSWDSEPSESDESYGKEKKKQKARPKPTPKRRPAKKRKPAKKKVKKKVGSDDDSEDSDFETSSRKRNFKKAQEKEKASVEEGAEVERKTRGVVLNTKFEDNDWHGGKEYSDDDSF